MLKKTICIILSIFCLNLAVSAVDGPANDNADLDKQIKAVVKTMYLPKRQITFDLYWKNMDISSEKVFRLDKDAVKIKYYRDDDLLYTNSPKPTSATFYKNKTIQSFSFAYDGTLLPTLYSISNGASVVTTLRPSGYYAILGLDNGKKDAISLDDMFLRGGSIDPRYKAISTGLERYRSLGLTETEENQHVLLKLEKSLLSKKVKDQIAKSNLDLSKAKAVVIDHFDPIISRYNKPILLYDGTTEYLLIIKGAHYVQGFDYPLNETSKKDYREFTFESERLYNFRKEILPLFIHEVEVFKQSGYDY